MKSKRILLRRICFYPVFFLLVIPGLAGAMTDFLLSSFDPSASAMADAGSGLIEKGAIFNINPAGGQDIEKYEAGIYYSQRYNNLDLFGIKSRIPVYNRISLSCNILYSGTSVRETDIYGQETGKEGSVRTCLENMGLSFRIADDLYSGAGIKFIQDYPGDVYASYQVLDYGLMYKWRFLSAGLSVLNNSLGGKILYGDEAVFIPSTKRAGAGAVLLQNKLYLAADFLWGDILEERLKFGAEYRLLNYIFLRTGYDTFYGAEYEFINGLYCGFGVTWKNIKLDYSWQKAGSWQSEEVLLSGCNRLGLSYVFDL